MENKTLTKIGNSEISIGLFMSIATIALNPNPKAISINPPIAHIITASTIN